MLGVLSYIVTFIFITLIYIYPHFLLFFRVQSSQKKREYDKKNPYFAYESP